jgi:hypothetical protein
MTLSVKKVPAITASQEKNRYRPIVVIDVDRDARQAIELPSTLALDCGNLVLRGGW